MKSIIKYLVYFLAVVLLLWWLVSTFKGKSTDETSLENTETENILSENGEEDLSIDDLLEDADDNTQKGNISQDVDVSSNADEQTSGEDESDDILIDDTSTPPSTETSTTPAIPPTTTKVKMNSGTSSGRYFVIVGSFIVPGNAHTLERKLKNMGYSGAEVVNFDLSEYHTVLAGRYGTLSEAKQAERALKAKGMDAYVQRRKQ